MCNKGIYKIIFPGCRRVYIGQSIDFKNRRKYHRFELKKGTHYNSKLQRAYNKYGGDKMSIFLIEPYLGMDLNTREIYYISLYDSYVSGLNNAPGGYIKPFLNSKKVYQYCAKTGELIREVLGYKNAQYITGVGESNIRQCCYGKMKTAKGYHFSHDIKTTDQVLLDIIPNFYSEEFRSRSRESFSGDKNPMFGKKRPELSGAKNPYAIKIKNGYQPKRRVDWSEVVSMYRSGLTQKQISERLKCTQAQVSFILRENGISKFKRAH